MTNERVIRFCDDDLEVFSRASGDKNPLHLSAVYASRTAYGQQVVYGALGAVACLGAVSKLDGVLTRLTADFQRPLFLGVDYRLEINRSHGGVVSRLFDGSTPVLSVAAKFSTEQSLPIAPPKVAKFPLEAARVRRWKDLAVGLAADGEYRSDPSALRELLHRFSLDINPMVAEALLWSSYFVGMELPGESALFFRATLDFHGVADPEAALTFRTRIAALNGSIAQARTQIELNSKDRCVVSGQLTAFVRPEIPAMRLTDIEDAATRALAGKISVVIGASRGLGAALAVTLAAAGSQVVAISRSEVTWKSELPASISDHVSFWEGDASDAAGMESLVKRIVKKHGRVDILVCSAFPAIPSLRLEPGATSRIQEYITRSLDLVLNPLCALLPQLSASGGCGLLISSAAVEQPVRDWPHYVAAKSAAESVFRIAPMQFPGVGALIVRPERLLTEMTNTPMGRKGAASPLELAKKITLRMEDLPRPGTCEILELKTSSPAPVSDVQHGEALVRS